MIPWMALYIIQQMRPKPKPAQIAVKKPAKKRPISSEDFFTRLRRSVGEG